MVVVVVIVAVIMIKEIVVAVVVLIVVVVVVVVVVDVNALFILLHNVLSPNLHFSINSFTDIQMSPFMYAFYLYTPL